MRLTDIGAWRSRGVELGRAVLCDRPAGRPGLVDGLRFEGAWHAGDRSGVRHHSVRLHRHRRARSACRRCGERGLELTDLRKQLRQLKLQEIDDMPYNNLL